MMSKFYELTSSACPMFGTSQVARAARIGSRRKTLPVLSGCWRTEFGALRRLLILRSFDTSDAPDQERRRGLSSDKARLIN